MRPRLDDRFESNIPGLYVIGDLAGAAVVKQAMEQGHRVALEIAGRPDARGTDPEAYDVLVAGAGAAGLNAALVARERGLRVLVLEKYRIANTIEEFPDGKWIYAEPEGVPAKGKLWLEASPKERLLAEWQRNIQESGLEVRSGEGLESLKKNTDGTFEVVSSKSCYRARRVILATGQRGNPRKLGVPGEDQPNVHHQLHGPSGYKDQDILVVGGGNGPVEAALALAEHNRVTLAYRGSELLRVFKENRRKLERSSVRLLFQTTITSLAGGVAAAGTQRIPFDHTFVLIGADPPADFLRSLGLRLEGDWDWRRIAALAVSSAIAYIACGVRLGHGHEFWPFRGWGYHALSFFDRPWTFWYTVIYTLLVTVFGIQAVKRWGFDRNDRFQVRRYVSLLGFQWVFFFLIPEFLFQWAIRFQWLGESLSRDPNFASNAWRSYGLVYAWPLFFYTFFGSPHDFWLVWGVVLSFVILPALALFHGKRYCSWICGCGGLAETLGDRWRHLAPKGRRSIQWERMNEVVLALAVVVTLLMLGRDSIDAFRAPADFGIVWYRLIVDVWLVGIVPLALYPILGGKIWCRYWCPLAKMLEFFSALYTRFRISRFAIRANEKCIACGECSRYCQVGIDVMRFALKQQELNNLNSSCIGCGICITACPMSVLSFGPQAAETRLVQISSN